MKKIRINELARELEVKAHEILDKLPELGVSEKKTHSSSIDEDVAIKLRRFFGKAAPNGQHEVEDEEELPEAAEQVVTEEAAPAREERQEEPAVFEPAAPAEAAPQAEAAVEKP